MQSCDGHRWVTPSAKQCKLFFVISNNVDGFLSFFSFRLLSTLLRPLLVNAMWSMHTLEKKINYPKKYTSQNGVVHILRDRNHWLKQDAHSLAHEEVTGVYLYPTGEQIVERTKPFKMNGSHMFSHLSFSILHISK